MRVRLASLGVVAGVLIVVACGSNDAVDVLTTPDGGPEGSVLAPDGASATGIACDPATCEGARKCDATLGCVQCVGDGDCTTANGAPFCIRGRCEACRSNADCGAAAPSCYPGDHRCHRSCAVDGGARCSGDTPLCDSATGACVGCNTKDDCPAAEPLCEPTTRSCVACIQAADCPAAQPRCSPLSFRCVTCLSTADCPSGQRCNGDGRCETACTSDEQCAGGDRRRCDVARGDCVRCLGPADCAGTNTPLCGDRGCVQCVTSSDCADSGAPICREGRCVECHNDDDCPGADPKCDNGRCR